MIIRTLPLFDSEPDGSPSRWPTADKGYVRNDEFFLQKIANDFWAKDRDQADLGGPPSIATWRLDRLPHGYAGFEKQRPDSNHVDRYLYGHARGTFRSPQEFYPHFKNLMDNGSATGCPCKLCSGNKRASTSGGKGARSVSPIRTSNYFPQTQTKPSKSSQHAPLPHRHQHERPNDMPILAHGRLSSPSPARPPKKQVDEDGSTDIYRALLDELKSTKEGTVIDKNIIESTSPDWRVGNDLLKELLEEWKTQPRFVPRTGELVLFARDLRPEETLAWVEADRTWRKAEQDTDVLLERPIWEAGVITQMPLQQIDEEDLISSSDATSNVVNSGFRIEPLAEVGNQDKRYAKQHRYLPLHAIRPLVYWHDCIRDVPEADWHPTLKHALSVSNTFCVIGRHRFKGVRNDLHGSQATVFCRGAYIGFELVTVGDVVRLIPNPDEQKPEDVTDIMIVTAIKLRLVNIDEAGDDDWDEGRPYTICLHVSGQGFTLDSKRSFDGVGKAPIPSDSDLLPPGLEAYGKWYHMTDPQQPKSRLEVPFTRILGRVFEDDALETWFQLGHTPLPSPVQGFRKPTKTTVSLALQRGIPGLSQARNYSQAQDPRIDKAAGKSWFWADTRVEALDLHEVNNRFVGPKDETRTKAQMEGWRKLLRALDGSKRGLADYHAERVKREEENRKGKQGIAAAGGYGMVGAALTIPDVNTSGSGTEADGLAVKEEQDRDMVDVGEEEDEDEEEEDDEEDDLAAPDTTGGGFKTANADGVIELSDDST